MKKNITANRKSATKSTATFNDYIEKPVVAILILLVITTLVYSRSLFLDYTRLDDSIFIVENAHYNSDLNNLGVSFHRGLFNPTKDAYYRPMFLVDFILESRLFGTNPAGYHFTNLLFHLISVCLLYLFLRKITLPAPDALLLTILFAVHPVLTQAVAWIPGRNDMLLMIFFLGSFITLLKFIEKPGALSFTGQAIFMLIALFTKETAVIIPVIMAGFVLFFMKTPWQKLILPFVSWVIVVAVWFFVRSTATLEKNWISPSAMISAGIDRLGVIVQYLGKIFLPVNLAVFPEYQDVSLIWGFISIAFATALIIYSKSYKKPLTYLGLFWFLIFLLPVLIVPKTLNDQIFEHRLYLPLVGILLMLSQVFPFTSPLEKNHKILLVSIIIVVFSAQSIYRTAYFRDAITFWTKAVEGSPHSAYAHTLLGTKVEAADRREQLFRRAYQLDPNLKNLNYYIGKVLFEKKQVDSSEIFLRREIVKNPIPDAYFLLAQISFEKGVYDSATVFLEKVIELDPLHPQANYNLVLMYFQHGDKEKAKLALKAMELKGMEISPDLSNMFKNTP